MRFVIYIKKILILFFFRTPLVFFSGKKKVRVLFVGQTHSPHFRSFFDFISNVNDFVSFRFLNSYPIFPRVIPDYFGYTIFTYISELLSFTRFKKFFEKMHANAIYTNSFKILTFKLQIFFFKPHVIWLHELQSSGYLILKYIPNNCTLCVTIYGNDLYWYKDTKAHRDNIIFLLKRADFVHVETYRDRDLALKLGFTGTFFPISSATLKNINIQHHMTPIKKDIFILLKGSDGYRTDNSAFFEFLSSNIIDFQFKRIVVVGPDSSDIYFSHLLANKGIVIDLLPSTDFYHYQDLLLRASFFLSNTTSDGVANSAVEAVSNNCIPLCTLHNGFLELAGIYSSYITVSDNFSLLDWNKIVSLSSSSKARIEILNFLSSSINSYFLSSSYTPFIDFFHLQSKNVHS